MYVTQHAADRINARLSLSDAYDTLTLLEGVQGVTGTVAYIVGNVPAYGSKPDTSKPVWWNESNGDTIIAVARDGSVETVFYRRSSQDMSAAFFGARKVIDMRNRTIIDRVEPEFYAVSTAAECEADMRAMTNGERGCSNPAEHRS